MKNAGMAGAVALVGIGLMTIGLSNFHSTPQAQAAPAAAAVNHGPEEPTIVWYGTNREYSYSNFAHGFRIFRVWSDGRIESTGFTVTTGNLANGGEGFCSSLRLIEPWGSWCVVDDPEVGTPAIADLNDNGTVAGDDLASLLGAWGPISRDVIQESDCQLNLINQSTRRMQGSGSIVWYDSVNVAQYYDSGLITHLILRAWSDGTIEARQVVDDPSPKVPACVFCTEIPGDAWTVISTPSQGYLSRIDLNFDEKINGADLATLLGFWGDAPPNRVPDIDCPLGLLNPS